MLLVPNNLYSRYANHLKSCGILTGHHGEYKKWLRYYLDYCDKYSPPDSKSERIRLFCEKLRGKKQSTGQVQRAAHAISLFFEMLQHEGPLNSVAVDISAEGGADDVVMPTVNDSKCPWFASGGPAMLEPKDEPGSRSPSGYTAAGYQGKSDSPEWDELLPSLSAEIKVRHYSHKTLKTYANWPRQFQRFLSYLPPFICHPPIAGWVRHPHNPDQTRSCQLENNDDLYPLRACPDGERGEKPPGFLKAGWYMDERGGGAMQ